MRFCGIVLLGTLFLLSPGHEASAVPTTVSLRIADVTTASFSVVWMTDIADVSPAVEIYRDAAMQQPISEGVSVTAMPDASPDVADAARQRGILKVRVAGLESGTDYYVRSLTADPGRTDSIGYSSLKKVTTANMAVAFRQEGTVVKQLANDLLTFKIYIRPGDETALPGLGNLIVLETGAGRSPLSTFVGEGISAPEGVLDLNNMFGADGISLDILGSENATLRIYRGGTSSTLLHYRKFAFDHGEGAVSEAVKGFFADFNLDGVVDAADFEMFKTIYRSSANDMDFNPDMNLAEETAGAVGEADRIDARDFSKFASEYGNTHAH